MYIPNSDMAPHAVHITKLRPIDPVLIKSPVGETNIPEPAVQYNKNYVHFFSFYKYYNDLRTILLHIIWFSTLFSLKI